MENSNNTEYTFAIDVDKIVSEAMEGFEDRISETISESFADLHADVESIFNPAPLPHRMAARACGWMVRYSQFWADLCVRLGSPHQELRDQELMFRRARREFLRGNGKLASAILSR